MAGLYPAILDVPCGGSLGRVEHLRLPVRVGRTLPVLARSRLAGQRRQRLRPLEVDPGALGDATAVILVAMPEVPDHPEGQLLWTLLEVTRDIADQVLALPVLEGAVALARLGIIIGNSG